MSDKEEMSLIPHLCPWNLQQYNAPGLHTVSAWKILSELEAEAKAKRLKQPAPTWTVDLCHPHTYHCPDITRAILFYRRLIDDAFMIVDTSLLPEGVMAAAFAKALEKIMQFGSLKWEAENVTTEVNFLYLTLTMSPNGYIRSRTYMKPLNLHLYIPPHSAHPKGVLKSLVFGNVQRYWQQNTERSDFIRIAKDFF